MYSLPNILYILPIHFAVNFLQSLMQAMQVGGSSDKKVDCEQFLETVDFDGIVKYMKSDRCRNIITMAGAGISTCMYLYHCIIIIVSVSVSM